MSLFNPDPDLPHWEARVPTEMDFAQASDEQVAGWFALNAHIAFVHTAWGNLERHLSLLFAAILKVKMAQAEVILATLSANKVKRDIITNIANITLASHARRSGVERLMRRIAKVASKRNFLAHGTAVLHQKYPGHVTVIGVSPDLEPALSHYQAYGMGDLAETADTINAISADLYTEAGLAAKARRRPLPQTPLRELADSPIVSANLRRPPRAAPSNPPQASPRKERPRKLSSAQKRAMRQRGGEPPSD